MTLSPYLLAPILAWLVAQILKYLIQAIRTGNKANLSYLYSSGDMPSGHSAIMTSLVVVSGVVDGYDSSVFGIMVALSAIIIYDSMNVRRSVGEQGEVLRKLAKNNKFFVAKGHTIPEVIAGILLGAVIGVAVLQFI